MYCQLCYQHLYWTHLESNTGLVPEDRQQFVLCAGLGDICICFFSALSNESMKLGFAHGCCDQGKSDASETLAVEQSM